MADRAVAGGPAGVGAEGKRPAGRADVTDITRALKEMPEGADSEHDRLRHESEPRMHPPLSTSRLRTAAVVAGLLATLVLAPAAHAEEPSGEVRSPLEPVIERTMSEGLPSMTSQIKKVAIGSTGATVTLAAGDEVLIDLSGLTGAGGGTNYLGLGMLLFGLSVLTRLLSTVGRIVRPFARRRDRGWDE